MFTSAEGTSMGTAQEGAFPLLIRGVRGIPRENCRTSVESILMHSETIMNVTYWSKIMWPEISYSQDSPCQRNAKGIRKMSVD